MDLQEIFDRVAKHLLTQNAKSINTDNGRPECRYRSNDGLKCAVGCLIPDEFYTSSMEGVGIRNLKVSGPLRRAGVVDTQEDLNFLFSLQRIHDDSPPEEWSYRLAILARQHDLTFNAKKEQA